MHRNRAISILVIAVGTMYYTWVKSVEAAPAPARVAPAIPKDDVEASAGIPLDEIEGEVHDWQDEKRRQSA